MPDEERSLPLADPTALTTAQLLREVASLHALLDTKIDMVAERVDTHLESLRELMNERERANQQALLNALTSTAS